MISNSARSLLSAAFASSRYRIIRLPYNHIAFFSEIPPGFSATIIPGCSTDILDVRPILFHFLSKNGARKHHEGRDGGMKYEPGVRTLESI